MPTADEIALCIDAAPAWAKLALSVRSERLREDAVKEIARHVHKRLYDVPRGDEGQLVLPL